MARIHNDKFCPFCGEVVAYAEYENVKDSFYGDAFSGMRYTEHECEGSLRNRESIAKAFDTAMTEIDDKRRKE